MKKHIILIVTGILLVGLLTVGIIQVQGTSTSQKDFTIAWLKIGDWYSDYPEAPMNLQTHPDLPTGWTINYKAVDFSEISEEIDILVITGHYHYAFTDAQKDILDSYVKNGGLLWMDDCANLELDNLPLEIDFGRNQYRYWGRSYGDYYEIKITDHPLINGVYSISESEIRTDPVNEAQWFTPFYDWDPAYEVVLWGDDISGFNQDGAAILAVEYGCGRIVATAMDITCGLEAKKYGNWPAPRFDFRLLYNMFVWAAEPCFIPVLLDIKPQSCPNPLNINSQGVLPVAVLDTEDFDVTTIDPTSIQLAGVAPIRSSIEDVSTPVLDKQDECYCTAEGADGFADLTLKFDTQEIVAALGEVTDGDELVLILTGELLDGTPIEGEDCIVVLSKGEKGKKK
jgi:hypothetical protein